MPGPNQIAPPFDLSCLSVMQHYGVPTRLLDWTSDFWTAVYFACAGDPSEDGELWFYDRSIFGAPLTTDESRFLQDRAAGRIAELDPRLTPRMRQQVAHHTVSSNVFADHAPLIYELATEIDADCFRRYVINSECKEKSLRFLADYKGLTASSIFPDVEGLGKFLRWHLESLVTTLVAP